MRALVTVGTGFIGSHPAERLQTTGSTKYSAGHLAVETNSNDRNTKFKT